MEQAFQELIEDMVDWLDSNTTSDSIANDIICILKYYRKSTHMTTDEDNMTMSTGAQTQIDLGQHAFFAGLLWSGHWVGNQEAYHKKHRSR
jgi:hypothetical protein